MLRNSLISALILISIWQISIWLTQVPSFILPAPLKVVYSFWDNKSLIGEHALITFIEVVLGLAIGVVLGIATALNLATSHNSRAFLRPILVFSQAFPFFALAPLLTLWFGFGLTPKIIMAVIIIYFPVASAFFDGLMTTPAGYLDLAKSLGATRTQTLWRIRVPAALPALGSGLRLGAVYGPIAAIIGEWVGASKGLGYLMLLANGRVKTDLLFASLLTLATLTVIFYLLIDWLVRRFIETR